MTQNKTEIRKMRILDLMEEPSYVPMREKELACIMQVDPEDKPELKRIPNRSSSCLPEFLPAIKRALALYRLKAGKRTFISLRIR